ncbi:hypothetical protein ACA910_001835 [Epithemia clementina (nom. ined.)]
MCSGGQRRVLAVGAALLTDPAVLLLDEPLSGLDSAACEQLMQLLHTVAKEHNRTVLVTLHQPSDAIQEYLHKIVVMMQGTVVFNEHVEVVQNAVAMGGNRKRPSEFLHSVVKHGKVVQKAMNRSLANCREKREASMHGIILPRERMAPSKEKRQPLAQVMVLGQRFRLNYGFNFADIIALPVCFTVLSLALSFDADAPRAIFMGCIVMFFIPIVLFPHHLHLSWDIWRTHRWELDDRQISVSSFQTASIAFSLSMPLLAIVASLALAYAILGWDWASFSNQALFGVVFLTVIIKFGRSLIFLCNGNYSVFMMIYLTCIILFVVFGGLVISPTRAPESARWLFGMSLTFGAFSGILTSQFEYNNAIGEKPCLSFATCVMYDGNFSSAFSGFWPYSNTGIDLNILSRVYVCLFLAEFFILRHRRAQFLDPSSVQKPDKQGGKNRSQ